MEKQRLKMYESFFVGAILAVIGGYLDAYTYIARGQVFANAQTGNVVLLGLRAADGEWARALMYLMPIIAFALGIFLSESVRRHFDKGKLHWQQYIILLELAVITIVSLFPRGMYNNVNLFYHFIIPVIAFINYFIYEKHENRYKYALYGVIPLFLYSIYYIYPYYL